MNKYGIISLSTLLFIMFFVFTIRLDANPYFIIIASIILAIIGIILTFYEKKAFMIIFLILLHSMTLTYLCILLATVLFLDARVYNE